MTKILVLSNEYCIFFIKKVGIRIHPDPLHLAGVGSGSTFPGSGFASMVETRAGEPANFFPAPAPAPAPYFFFQAAPAPAPRFFSSGSGSGAKNTRLRPRLLTIG